MKMEEPKMPNYDDLKKKAMDALDTIADVSMEAYKAAEEKARVLARRAKLNAEITRERALIRRAKIRIGDIYYEQYKDNPGEAFKPICDEITEWLELIAVKQAELEALKKGYSAYDGDEESSQPPPEKTDEEPKG
jgi:FtsZ-binding cell division protein ZapB